MKPLLFCLAALFVAAGASGDEAHDKAHAKWIQDEIKKSAKKLLHLRGNEPFEIPVDVTVILIGFDGTGAFQYSLDEEALESLLLENHELRRPVARETGEPLSTQFLVDYIIQDTVGQDQNSTEILMELEQLMKMNMAPTHKSSLIAELYYAQSGFGNWTTYAIDATALEPKLDEIVMRALNEKNPIPGAPVWFDRNVIVVMNPSKRRMRPLSSDPDPFADIADFSLEQWNNLEFDTHSATKEEGGYGYYYSYDGAGMSSTWISHKNYVVIDISAGPVKFGQEMAPSGAVSPHVLPRILDVLYEGTAPLILHYPQKSQKEFREHIADVRDTMFRGRLAATIVSAMNHIFLNDVWIDNALDSRRIMVPMMVLRNHADFNPFSQHPVYGINGTAIQEELKNVVGGKIAVTESLHSLHQHKALAVALYKSMSAKSEATMTRPKDGQTVHAQLKHYIDSDILLKEFSLAADILAAAWIPEERKKTDRSATQQKVASQLTRTLPVFILSLKDVPFGLTFQNDELVVSNGEIVIVLQTVGLYEGERFEAKYTGHFVGDEPVVMSTLSVERHIMAGLVTSLTGSPPPYEVYSSGRGEVIRNWLWAVGHTPFGPYSSCKALSLVEMHAAHRNALVGRLEKLLRRVREASMQLDNFIAQYSPVLPLKLEGESQGLQKDSNWIDYLYRRSESFVEPPLPDDIVRQVEQMMEGIEGMLIELSSHFFAAEFNKADDQMRLLGRSVSSFCARVRNELRRAEDKLRCCHVDYKPVDSTAGSWNAFWMTAGVIALLIIIYVNVPIIETNSPLLGH